MMNTLYWVAGAIVVGAMLGRLIYAFSGYMLEFIKRQEEKE